MSPYAPRIYTTKIPQDKIRDVIGPGGKVIRGIIEQTGVKIDVEDDGTIHVASNDPVAAKKALQIIGDLTATAEIGKTYLGKVVRLVDFGAFVEIFPGTDGLLHISEIAENRIKEVRDELKEGDQILVKVLGIEGNKIKLSRKAVLREQREKLAQAQRISSGQPDQGKGPSLRAWPFFRLQRRHFGANRRKYSTVRRMPHFQRNHGLPSQQSPGLRNVRTRAASDRLPAAAW